MPVEQPTFSNEELQSETWKPIIGYEGHYEISNLGRVRSLKSYHGFKPGRILRYGSEKSGYLKVELSLNSTYKTHKVHQLVAFHFIGPRPSPQHEVNHMDGSKVNCRADNLEYRTKKGNMEHAALMNLTPKGERHGSKTHPERVARGDRCGFRTHPENIRRGDDHWTRRRPNAQAGANNHFAKATAEQRIAIRAEYAAGGISLRRLGQKYNLSKGGVWNLIKSRA